MKPLVEKQEWASVQLAADIGSFWTHGFGGQIHVCGFCPSSLGFRDVKCGARLAFALVSPPWCVAQKLKRVPPVCGWSFH